MADKDKIVKILKFVKIGLKLLLDIGLEVLSPNKSPLVFKSWRKSPLDVTTFPVFFEKLQS